jgi:DNA-binding NarL/FixJ family response regulator
MGAMPSVRVVLVDDHDVLRLGLFSLVSSLPGFEVVGEAQTAHAALQLVEQSKPDVVLMDLALPGMDGIMATREILRRTPRARIVFLSAHKEAHEVVNAMRAGAVGYVLKADPPQTLVDALDHAVRGARYVAPVLAGRVAAFKSTDATVDALGVLSERERQVFHLAADCRPRREIARELRLALRTIDTLLGRINRKLGFRSRADLVRYAVSIDCRPAADPFSAAS